MIKNSIIVGNKKIENRVVLQPMEGCDCNLDGSPSQLTVEKYKKAARSGAGLVWFEANAVCKEGRTNPRQMMLTKDNLIKFKLLLNEMREIATLIDLTLKDFDKNQEEVINRVEKLCKDFPIYC